MDSEESGNSNWVHRIPLANLVRAAFQELTAFLARISTWLEPRKDAFVDVCIFLRGAALPSVALAFAFAALDQTHEIYLRLAEDGARFGDLWREPDGALRMWRVALGFVFLGMFCLTLWHNARWMSLRGTHLWWQEDGGGNLNHKSPEYRRYRGLLTRWMPRVLGALPAGGMAAGLALTAMSSEAGESGVQTALVLAALISLTIGGAFLAFVIRRRAGDASYGDDHKCFDGIQRVGLWSFIVFTVLVALFRVSPAQMLGPVSILCLFGVGLCVILTALTDHSHRCHIPWVGILVGLALLLSVADVNDNHRLNLATVSRPASIPETPARAFDAWLEARRARSGNAAGDFEVYVVAAQGGGLYAAYHTAIMLARAQDTNPDFADHLFAVSGVSGGSVGAVVFHAVLNACRSKPDTVDCHVGMVREVLRRDFLSPTLASMLFTDFTARFLPVPGDRMSLLSRARALEAGFAAALRRAGADPEVLLARSWSEGGASGPLMLLNTTDVDTGERMVMTPLKRIYVPGPDHDGNESYLTPVETLAEVLGCSGPGVICQSPRLLTAALVSARFPFVTPAARLVLENGKDRRFVDGGYFENSGVETALDLLNEIGRRDGVRFNLVAMDFPGKPSGERDRSYWLGELMSPVRAFLNARSARGELAKRRAERGHEWISYYSASLDDTAAQFTLGWALSARTFDQIEFDLWNDDLADRLDGDPTRFEPCANRALLRKLAGTGDYMNEHLACETSRVAS